MACLHLFARGPDVPQEHVGCRRDPGRAGRFVRSMSVVPGQRVGDDQRRAGQIVGFDQRVDAALKVAIAAQHRRGHQIALRHRLGHRFGQRAAVADARGAAVADGVEAQLIQRLGQAGSFPDSP